MNELKTLSLLTKDEVAELLQVSKATITNYMKRGILKYYKFNDKTIRFSRKHIVDFLKNMESKN